MKFKLLIVFALLLITVAGWLACMQANTTGVSAMPDKISYNFHDDLRVTISFFYFFCQFQPIHIAHINICYHDIRILFGNDKKPFPSVRCLKDLVDGKSF